MKNSYTMGEWKALRPEERAEFIMRAFREVIAETPNLKGVSPVAVESSEGLFVPSETGETMRVDAVEMEDVN